MAKLNYELLAICLDRRSLDGAFSKSKSNARYVRSKKHNMFGKTISHRNGKVEKEYAKSVFIEKSILQIRLIQDSLVKTGMIDLKLSLEENLKRLDYTLNDANMQVDKFVKDCNIEVLFNEKKVGGYFAFRLFAGDQFNIEKYK